jgi:hypothetical protein
MLKFQRILINSSIRRDVLLKELKVSLSQNNFIFQIIFFVQKTIVLKLFD